MDGTIKIGLVGAGMFGADVHLSAYAGLQLSGLSPQLGRVGLDFWARDLAPIRFELAAIATRTAESALRAQAEFKKRTSHEPRIFWGETPWLDLLRSVPDLDVLAVATPDHLHTAAILAGLEAGAHVLTEKPMCLSVHEADQIIESARLAGRLVAVDMHKRFDPDHLRICRELKSAIGEPLYGVAYLEEPIALPLSRFKWAHHSDPFSYVGSHWVDLICHYFDSNPLSLTAVGQKKRLVQKGVDAYDAVQVRIDFANCLSMHFHNHWVTPPDFEGPVNQGHELVGTLGKIESDQQYRGLRWWVEGQGSRTANTHFVREIPRPEGPAAVVGYGVDSIATALASICRAKFFGASPESLSGLFPNASEARRVVAIVHASRLVCDLNFKYLQAGRGAPATALFAADGIHILDPLRAVEGPAAVDHRFYDKAL